MTRALELRVNGETHRLEVDPERDLLGILREDLGLTGAKYGCGEGRCGACTVLVDGQRVQSCLARVSAFDGKAITTIEGLASEDGPLHPVQQAFLDAGALQCGYCTPGMILAGVGFLEENAEPTDAEIIEGMQGNICRCGTYPRIIAAIQSAAEAMKGGAR
ncbi:(2Fe-2S)-binding protein [soil metagenome]